MIMAVAGGAVFAIVCIGLVWIVLMTLFRLW
jgi:hypothetical protein